MHRFFTKSGEVIRSLSSTNLSKSADFFEETARAAMDGTTVRNVGLAVDTDAGTLAALLGALRAGSNVVLYPGAAPPALRRHYEETVPVAVTLDQRLARFSTADGQDGARGRLLSVEDHPDLASSSITIFSSGTTGPPKGVVLPFAATTAQVCSISSAWQLHPDDRLLHLLPLYHVHGLVNGLLAAWTHGFSLDFLSPADGPTVWRALSGVSLLYGVPTVYHRLLSAHAAAARHDRTSWGVTAASLRLAVSGSAALPPVVGSTWADLAGDLPLERYGMSETGMILGNPLDGPRVAGHVGFPMPDVEVRLDDAGQVLVRSPGLFSGYYGRPEETAECFTPDGFFATGDTAEVDNEVHGGSYRLLGRTSVDILKSNGYKISALDIENVLLRHKLVTECAVVGEADEAKGQAIVAVVVFENADTIDCSKALVELEDHAREHLLPYQVPHRWKVVPALARNALGKVNKKELSRLLVELGNA